MGERSPDPPGHAVSPLTGIERVFDTRTMPNMNVPEGVLSWEWQPMNVPGVPARQPVELRLNGEAIPSGVQSMPWLQVIQYWERDRS